MPNKLNEQIKNYEAFVVRATIGISFALLSIDYMLPDPSVWRRITGIVVLTASIYLVFTSLVRLYKL